MNSGDKKLKTIVLAPPYVTIEGRKIPVDIPLLILGIILTFFHQQVATYLQATPALANDLLVIGQLSLLVGAVFFIFGRIRLR